MKIIQYFLKEEPVLERVCVCVCVCASACVCSHKQFPLCDEEFSWGHRTEALIGGDEEERAHPETYKLLLVDNQREFYKI